MGVSLPLFTKTVFFVISIIFKHASTYRVTRGIYVPPLYNDTLILNIIRNFVIEFPLTDFQFPPTVIEIPLTE